MIPFFTTPTFDYIFYTLFYKTVIFSLFFFLNGSLSYIYIYIYIYTHNNYYSLFSFIFCETQKSYIKSFCITYNYLYIYISTIAKSHFAQPFHNLIQLILSIINYILDFGLFYINRCECSRAVYSFRLLVILLA